MIRRNFIKGLSLFGIAGAAPYTRSVVSQRTPAIPNDRDYWIKTISKIVSPVLTALSQQKLKATMPVETSAGAQSRQQVSHLEALGRSLTGIAPWLELGEDTTAEGKERKKFIDLAVSSIRNAVTPSSPDYMNFTEGAQPLVDAAFLAHALIRAPRQLWRNLDATTQKHLVTALESTRVITPYYSNWLLFTAMIEAALLKFTGHYDAVRIDYALKQHEAWYKGDGIYGDGPDFHYDYYNSYVIQPMMLDIVRTIYQEKGAMKDILPVVEKRAVRYAAIQERLISPEGTFPPVGRSLAYRCGAFQLLAQVALQKILPAALPPAQVRAALTAVMKRSMEAPGTFDKAGWLTIGFAGHQPEVGEHYISTGSLYLCSAAFLPLGLPESDEFWSGTAVDWTSKRAYSGQNFPIDKAI
ncbi:MAG TPA: DUF2264 domain-containing protein [Ohtaekwangia sp.]|uniref:DUF2264 domain-containing protein n=1 Tax=Ohtaekwangia sp. TaxID=2066019 RepID=UPI002F93390E